MSLELEQVNNIFPHLERKRKINFFFFFSLPAFVLFNSLLETHFLRYFKLQPELGDHIWVTI